MGDELGDDIYSLGKAAPQAMYRRHSRQRGDPSSLLLQSKWIPAFAGMTTKGLCRHTLATRARDAMPSCPARCR